MAHPQKREQGNDELKQQDDEEGVAVQMKSFYHTALADAQLRSHDAKMRLVSAIVKGTFADTMHFISDRRDRSLIWAAGAIDSTFGERGARSRVWAVEAIESIVANVSRKPAVQAVSKYTKTKLAEASASVQSVADRPDVQLMVVSAATGATALAARCGDAGLVAGGSIGTMCGLIAAPITFGLSIPFGAAIGGGSGLCCGAVTGGVVGLLGGGFKACSGFIKRVDLY